MRYRIRVERCGRVTATMAILRVRNERMSMSSLPVDRYGLCVGAGVLGRMPLDVAEVIAPFEPARVRWWLAGGNPWTHALIEPGAVTTTEAPASSRPMLLSFAMTFSTC